MKKMIFIGSITNGSFENLPPKNSEVHAEWIEQPFIGCPHGAWLIKDYEYDLENYEQWFYKEELAEPLDTKAIAEEFEEVIERQIKKPELV